MNSALVRRESFVYVPYDSKYMPGILKIPWSEVLCIFDGIYLSWDPTMWKHQINFHGHVSIRNVV
jgi:hypothetical protein